MIKYRGGYPLSIQNRSCVTRDQKNDAMIKTLNSKRVVY